MKDYIQGTGTNTIRDRYDVTPIFKNYNLFKIFVDDLTFKIKDKIDCVVSFDALGFILGVAISKKLKVRFIPIIIHPLFLSYIFINEQME